MKIQMGGKMVEFAEGSVAEETLKIRERIRAARAAENANFDATPLKRER